jgi:quercetin dioxygenase-like cupin family protein
MLKATQWDSVSPEQLNPKLTRQMVNGENATLAKIFLARGCVVPRHEHANEQYSMVVSGALKFIFDDGEMVLRPGEVLVIPGHVPHAAEALEDTWNFDFFAPRREDWITKNDAYLRK